jgi:RNA polymerase sigma-70 factor (ECF subfamily)
MIGVMGTDTAAADATVRQNFITVYRDSVGEVFSYLASRVGDRSTAEDLTQDVFVAGANRFAAGQLIDTAWLIAVARNKLVDHWRARTREERKLALAHSAPPPPEDEPTTIDPGAAAIALTTLNPTYRAALVLRHVDDLSVPEVARSLGRTVEATEQILTRARAAFRRSYQETAS